MSPLSPSFAEAAPPSPVGATGTGRLLPARVDLGIIVAAASFAVIVINVAVVINHARSEKRAAIAGAIEQNSNLAVAFEQYTTRTIASADSITQVLKREFARRGRQINLADLMANDVIDPRSFIAASIFDQDGNLVATSDAKEAEALGNVATRDDFTVHLRQNGGKAVLGTPVTSPDTNLPPTIPITRRLNKSDGSFGGVVLLQIESSHFTKFYDAVSRRPNDVLSLIGLDGIARARRTGQIHTSGENLRVSPLFPRQASNPTGNFVADGVLDGVRRLISFRTLTDYPLVVAVGVSEADVLAPVAHRINLYYLRTAALIAVIIVFATLLIQALNRRKRTLAQLGASEATLAQAQRIAHMGSWTRDLQHDTTTMSDELFRILGVSPESFVPGWEAGQKIVHPEDREEYAESRSRVVATLQPDERFYRIIRPDGETRTLHQHVVVEAGADGAALRVHGTAQDVTEAREAERQSREQANLLNLTRDAIIVRELDDTIRFWNQGAEQLYGWKAEEVLGRKMLDFADANTADFLAANISLGEDGAWSGEMRQLRKDGSAVDVNSRWSAMPDERGKAKSILIVNTDITEQKQLEQQLLRAQRLESIGTLASGVAHDLNNILSPMLMAAPLFRDEMPANTREKLAAMIEQSAERGADIVKQLLTFARGTEGARVLVQAAHLLAKTAKVVKEGSPKSITVHMSCAEDLWLVEADATGLHQVLLNLCLNAQDAMPGGGRLSLSAENFEVDENYAAMTPGTKAGPYILIEVIDTGRGIPQHVIDKIYDPFFTTKGVSKRAGLGLATVLGIVQRHDGVVNAYSSESGTTFRVLLPAIRQPSLLRAPTVVKDLPQGHGETILIVDDEPTLREVAQALLLASGYRVLLADDGPTALALFAAQSNEIDLVLAELAMPIMDGVALARTLRKMEADVKLILSTGRDEGGETPETRDLGIDAYLTKPYTREKLLVTLDGILSGTRAAA